MRIIAGYLGGRIFESPHGHRTHPMGDRVRTALFNTLGDIKGLTVLDAFAGSGAISFEAVSRGAERAVAIEADKGAHEIILKNITSLGLEVKVETTRAFVHSWMRRTHEEFDIIVADPPYNDLQYKTLEKLHLRAKIQGILVFSLPPKARLLMPDTCELLTEKKYGDATLSFYRKIS
jgi:16S rRNA (guanine966-N2)-methyltransferase